MTKLLSFSPEHENRKYNNCQWPDTYDPVTVICPAHFLFVLNAFHAFFQLVIRLLFHIILLSWSAMINHWNIKYQFNRIMLLVSYNNNSYFFFCISDNLFTTIFYLQKLYPKPFFPISRCCADIFQISYQNCTKMNHRFVPCVTVALFSQLYASSGHRYLSR